MLGSLRKKFCQAAIARSDFQDRFAFHLGIADLAVENPMVLKKTLAKSFRARVHWARHSNN
jgi:hypothetical protein